MTCLPKRAHSPTASSTIEVLALSVGGGASGFHDDAGQGPSGGNPAALLTAGVGTDVQALARRRRTRDRLRISALPAPDAADHEGGHAFGVVLHREDLAARPPALARLRDADAGRLEACIRLGDVGG